MIIPTKTGSVIFYVLAKVVSSDLGQLYWYMSLSSYQVNDPPSLRGGGISSFVSDFSQTVRFLEWLARGPFHVYSRLFRPN